MIPSQQQLEGAILSLCEDRERSILYLSQTLEVELGHVAETCRIMANRGLLVARPGPWNSTYYLTA